MVKSEEFDTVGGLVLISSVSAWNSAVTFSLWVSRGFSHQASPNGEVCHFSASPPHGLCYHFLSPSINVLLRGWGEGIIPVGGGDLR